MCMYKNWVKVTIECRICCKNIKCAINKYYKHFTYCIQMLHQIHYIQLIKGLWVFFLIINSLTESKLCIFKCLFNVALNWALAFIRLVRLRDKLLKIFMPTYYALFWKHKMLAVDLHRLYKYLFFVLRLCIAELAWNVSWLLTLKYINKSAYSHSRGKIFNCLYS
jgi:hypothetical protein